MNTLIKFSDALCLPVSARRPTWPRGGFVNTTREQLAEIGRAFARGDKHTVDQACEELKASSLRRLRKTVSRNSPLNTWKELKGSLMSQRIFNSNTCRILFVTFLSALCLTALSAEPATINVLNTNDSGAGSLRQALADANDGDTIDFSVTTPATITLTSGELLVNKSVTISGPGADQLSVNGNASSRVFHISSGKTVSISRLAITNGYAVDGGGIYSDHATLTVNDSTVSGNSATNGGGIVNDGFLGSATLTINNSTVSGNLASAFGGGIHNEGFSGNATLTINNSTVSGNSNHFFGGGIYNDGLSGGNATLTINSSTVSGNSNNSFGGGIYNQGFSGSATLKINNSTLSGNLADNGGGIYNQGFSGSATLKINNSTLSGNSTYSGGTGGIYNDVLSGGSATLEIGNTILKTGASGENIFDDSGTVTSDGYNLSSDNDGGFLTATGDQINTDPMLGPLQDNGGPTFTHEPLSGSPAIDAGDPSFDPYSFNPPLLYDQRGPGFPRVVNGRIDIGAFEVQAAIPSYAAHIQPPINAEGTSIFTIRRGVVPVKFTLTLDGVATCDLPPATIAVTRTGGGVIGQVNESIYSGNADTGSNFRIDSCQYVYNLNSSALGVGIYRVDILINGQVVGSAAFQLQ
jgi:hypothetical protein